MKKFISLLIALILGISCTVVLVGCESSPISSVVIANEQYSDRVAIEKANQATELIKSKSIYASIYFIESPKGMNYKANWYYDGKVFKTDEKEMASNQHGVIVYELEAEKLKEGLWTFEIKYKNNVLLQREITIK